MILQFTSLKFTAGDCGRKIPRDNYLTFRCRLESRLPQDVHRNFSGCYNPRWRTIYINEIHIGANGSVKLLPVFPMATYTRAENNDYYYTRDFAAGNKLTLGENLRGCDEGVKTFVITDVDTSKLFTETKGLLGEHGKSYPDDVVDNIIRIRQSFIENAGDDAVMGIKLLSRKFKKIDTDGNRRLDAGEFYHCLKEEKIPITESEVCDIFSVLDKNCDGGVSHDEFLDIVRGPINEMRKRLVLESFRRVDYNRDGAIKAIDLERGYYGGDKTAAEFLRVWDIKDKNSAVTFDEFADYYYALSACVESDEMFTSIMRQCWRI